MWSIQFHASFVSINWGTKDSPVLLELKAEKKKMKTLKKNSIVTVLMFVCFAFASFNLFAQKKTLKTEKDGFKWYEYQFDTQNGVVYAAFDLNGNRLTPNVLRVFYYDDIQKIVTWEFKTYIGIDEKGNPQYGNVKGVYDKSGNCMISTDWMFNEILGLESDYLINGCKYKYINGSINSYDWVTFTKDGKYYAEGQYYMDFYSGGKYYAGNAAEFERKKKPMPQSKTTASYSNNASSNTPSSSSSNTNSSTASNSKKTGKKNYDFSAVCSSGQTLYYKIKDNNVSVVAPNDNTDYEESEGWAMAGYDVDVTYSFNWNGYSKPTGELIIPESVAYKGLQYKVIAIRRDAFGNCDGLSSVIIPASVSNISEDSFSGCKNIQRFVVLATTPPEIIPSNPYYYYALLLGMDDGITSIGVAEKAVLVVKPNMSRKFRETVWGDCFSKITEDSSLK